MSKKERYYILDSPNTMPFICDRFDNDKTIAEVHSDNVNQLCDLLNEQEETIQELETKLNQTALELLNYEMISMGKAVEISEMSYIDFLKYRKEHGNPMELQL